MSGTQHQKVQVLVVDDEEAHRRFLKRGLSMEGYHVHTTDSGVGCLHSLTQTLPDVLLLDIMLPDINGLEIAQTVKEQGLNVSILFLSGSDEPEIRAQIAQLGADFLVKPVDFEDLLSHLPPLN